MELKMTLERDGRTLVIVGDHEFLEKNAQKLIHNCNQRFDITEANVALWPGVEEPTEEMQFEMLQRYHDGELSAEQNALMVKKYGFGAHGDAGINKRSITA